MASNSAARQARQGAAEESAEKLAETRDEHERRRHGQNIARHQGGQIGVQAGEGKENGREKRCDHRAQLRRDGLGQNGGLADEDAGDQRAEHGLNAERLGGERGRAHDNQDERERHVFGEEVVVDDADGVRDQAAAQRQARGEEKRKPADRPADAPDVDSALADNSQDRRDHDPAEQVLDDR